MARMQKQHFLEELGPDVKISDPALWRLRQDDHKFEANLGKMLCQRERERTLEATAPVSDRPSQVFGGCG